MTAVLRCDSLGAGHGKTSVVRELDLTIDEGQIVAMVGPNGSGKTTLLLTLAGMLPRLGGSIEIAGHPFTRSSPAVASRLGVALVPDDRALFATLTVRENLTLAMRRGETLETILDQFPALALKLEVLVGALSGGEQQMLAIGRALIQRPRLLLIDELSMGLAPLIAERLVQIVRSVADETGTAVLLVEQHVHLALAIADRMVVLVHGEVGLAGSAEHFRNNLHEIERAYLGSSAVAHPN